MFRAWHVNCFVDSAASLGDISMTQQVINFSEFLDNPPFPKFVQFETNTTCNANCLMCPHDKMKKRPTAPWSLISKIIRETAPKTDAICPFLMQEPTLEPRLVPILANIKQRNPQCHTIVYSNMNYLPDTTTKAIIDQQLLDELHISFYGPTKELYKKWQPPLDRERTVTNIKKFFLYRAIQKRLKPKITLHVLSVPEIMNAVDGYADIRNYVDTIANVQYDTFHGDIPDHGGDQTAYMGPPAPRVPCQRLWTGMNIHSNGNVVPCCIDYNDENVLGNVAEKSVEEIWQGLKFTEFRRMHMEGKWNKIPMCRDCKVHEYQFNKEWTNYWINERGERHG